MQGQQFDALTRLFSRAGSRRDLLRQAGIAGLASLGFGRAGRAALAEDATPAADLATAQAAFDALDAETKDAVSRALWTTNITVDQIPPDALAQIIGLKNSNTAFGARMSARILQLIAQPSSFVQSYQPRYEALLPLTKSLTAHQAYLVSNLLGPENARGYSRVIGPANFQFPQRNATDLQSQIGWYFFVGSAIDESGQEYGIEVMFFRSALVPPDLASALQFDDIENQVVELHFAVAKAGARHYQAKPILVSGTTGLLSFEPDKLGATMGRNRISSGDDGNLYPIRLQAWGQDDGELEPVRFEVDLSFTDGKGYLLQGVDGCSPCCDGVGTYYYSIPGLVLDPASSVLTIDGNTVKLTEGTFWFDHQWGMLSAVPETEVFRAAGNLSPANPGGWDWFLGHLVGNRQLTVAALHTADYMEFYHQTGPNPPGVMTVEVSGKYMDPDAVTHTVMGQMSVTDWIRSVDTPSPDVYPPSYTWYPNQWEFSFGDDVPEDIRIFTAKPIVSTGQSGFFVFVAQQYSEGAVHLFGPDGKRLGSGFAESVGYAQTLPNALRLVGIEANIENMTLFGPNTPEPGLVAASQAFVALNQESLKELMETCLVL